MNKSLHTKHWLIHGYVDKDVDNLAKHAYIQEAAAWINREEVIAFPTETVYGLGANALSDKASRKIFEAKGRPSDNPLIIHISAVDELCKLVDNLPENGDKLIHAFWPGPLTLVLPKKKEVNPFVTANLPTVAVRMPDHPLALALIRASGTPLAAPSANRSGKPSPTRAEHVLHDLDGRIAGVLDGGRTGVGLESTVVDLTTERPMILRPGGVTKAQLESVVGTVEVDPALKQAHHQSPSVYTTFTTTDEPSLPLTDHALDAAYQPRSPGVKYQHYAPEGDMWLVSLVNGEQWMRDTLQKHVHTAKKEGYSVGVITTSEAVDFYHADLTLSIGQRKELSTVAQNIYSVLRKMDEAHIQRIYAESFPFEGIGEAVMNRLLKAAGGRMITQSP